MDLSVPAFVTPLFVFWNETTQTSRSQSFICHLKKIGADKLDNYSEIEFKLTQFGARLVFKAWLPLGKEPEEMTYTLPDLTLDLDERIAASKPFTLFGFRFA